MADKVVALVGPTGSGKSRLAQDFAAAVGAEIVAVDAFTVYRGMDVGTAKPSAAEREQVPHHMVDVLEPTEEATVQWFQQRARAAVDAVAARGALPLLVGGSGLYFRAVADPLEFPPTDADVRARIRERWRNDPQAAHDRLRAADPEAAARIDPANLRRTVRALEVIELTGRSFSDWRRAWDDYTSIYAGLAAVGVVLDPAELAERIARRVDRMLDEGLVAECRRLAVLDLSTTARQAIGYAEVFDHLAGRCTLAEAVEATKARTRRYAARQRRWFAADPRIEWAAPAEIPAILERCAS